MRHIKNTKNTKNTKKRYGWQTELSNIIKQYNPLASSGDKLISHRTGGKRIDILYQCFRELRDRLGFRIENPRNIKERHVHALANYWEKEGLSSSTIQNRLSILRVFAGWLGKGNMIKEGHLYVTNPDSVARDQVAREDKGWKAKEIDFEKVWTDIAEYDGRVGLQILLIKEFGMRRQEAVMFQPHVAVTKGERSNDIVVEFGTKGGRPRSVPVETDSQRAVLELAMEVVKTREGHVGWTDKTLKQALRRYSNVLTKFGVTKANMEITGHGLRHDYANDKYERMTGSPSPVRGGLKDVVNAEDDYVAKMQVSRALGHSRTSITASYFGSHATKKASKGMRAKQAITGMHIPY